MLQHHSDLRMVPLLELSCPIWISHMSWIFPSAPAATVSTSLSKRVVSCTDVLNLPHKIQCSECGLCLYGTLLCGCYIVIRFSTNLNILYNYNFCTFSSKYKCDVCVNQQALCIFFPPCPVKTHVVKDLAKTTVPFSHKAV